MDYAIPEIENVQLVMTDSGEIKQVPIRRPTGGQVAIVDWVNFTVGEETYSSITNLTDEDFVSSLSADLEEIFGFGVSEHIGTGRNYYRDSWKLGDGCGHVCFGGQNTTFLVMVSGHGCMIATAGWEGRLHDFLSTRACRPKLTRVDLAFDDFSGEIISVDWADEQDKKRGFCCSFGEPPTFQHLGAWRRPSGKGRTATIGLRSNGKYGRFYEKGKKDGDKSSPWTRCEIEFKSKDRILPFSILLDPSGYFVAAYPCLSFLSDIATPKRIETRKRTAEITFNKNQEVCRHQMGNSLFAGRGVWGDDTAYLDWLTAGKTIPRRVHIASAWLSPQPESIHRRIKHRLNDAEFENHLASISFLPAAYPRTTRNNRHQS